MDVMINIGDEQDSLAEVKAEETQEKKVDAPVAVVAATEENENSGVKISSAVAVAPKLDEAQKDALLMQLDTTVAEMQKTMDRMAKLLNRHGIKLSFSVKK